MGNAVLPGVVAKACREVGIPFGHVSSGCIFTGQSRDGQGFTEDDEPNFSFRQNNCSFYSGTKALGEEVLAAESRCYIWRMRIPFDNQNHPRNNLRKLMTYERLLEAENSLSHLDEFVQACLDSVQRQIPYGIYNLTNPGSVRTSDVTKLIAEYGLASKPVSFFRDEEEFMRVAAKTPRSNCVRDSTKALKAGLNLSPIEDVLRRSLASWESARCTVASE
jgi:dTDP-4-dehydrorhamnose reductase